MSSNDYEYYEDGNDEGSSAKHSRATNGKRRGAWLARILTMLGLSVCLVACGFFACLIPPATSVLARATVNNEVSPFTKDELVQVAEATRDYSFISHDLHELYRTIFRVNLEYQTENGIQAQLAQAAQEQQGTSAAGNAATTQTGSQASSNPFASMMPGLSSSQQAASASASAANTAGSGVEGTIIQPLANGMPNLDGVYEESTLTAFEAAFSGASTMYVFDRETIGHLDDCYNISRVALVVVAIIAGLSLIGLIVVGVRAGKRAVGWSFKAAGIFVLIAFVALAAWVIVDFNGFFTLFHQLFFAGGTWQFPYDSLLICSLPTGFWVGMGAIWIAVSALASILFIVIGSKLRKKRK